MKHIFIVNPTAASGKNKELSEIIATYCIQNQYAYQIYQTQYPKHATEIALSLHAQKDIIVYAVGGDGTVHEVLNGLPEHVPMCIIPAGTGNDFYRMIDEEDNIIKCIDNAINGKIVSVDYAIVNGQKFLNSTTIGLDARINAIACNHLKGTFIPKKLLYLIAALIGVFNPKPFSVKLKMDDTTLEKDVLLVGVMNGKYYGNGLSPILTLSIQDGYLNIIMIDKVGIFKLLQYLPKYLTGNIENVPVIHQFKANHITIEISELVDMQTDGENNTTNQLDIQMIKNGLRLQVPLNCELK